MNYKLHNKIEISNGKNNYTFFNTMLESICEQFKELKSYNDYLALGTGTGTHSTDNFHLLSYKKSYKLQDDIISNDISKSNEIFIKKNLVINDSTIDGIYITEAGITDKNILNPTIYNYFSFITDNTPNGILKEEGKPLEISIYIYLEISKSSDAFLTSGDNKFIEFLLGNGLRDKIYCTKGNNLSDNTKSISRGFPRNCKLTECESIFIKNESSFKLSFKANLGTGETSEIVFLIGNKPFARINLLEYKNTIVETKNHSCSSNNNIIIDENIKSIEYIENSDGLDYKLAKHGYNFSDKINLPFHNLFNNESPRFLSKDGKMIFFINNDKIYGYINEYHTISEIKTNGVSSNNITNIISFDKYVFIVSKSAPYISSYIVENNTFIKCSIDFNSFPQNSLLSNIYKIDITLGNNNRFMFGFLDNENHNGHILYYTFDRVNKMFYFENYYKSDYNFTNVLGMYKNTYCDAMIMFFKYNTTIYETRIVYFYQDKTNSETYSQEAYNILSDAKEIYIKGRALIVEKSYFPFINIYTYPSKNKYNILLENNEINDYLSTNLYYLIQKEKDFLYKIYNITDFDNPTLFSMGLPTQINPKQILDFEFLNDTLLIFLDSEYEKIVAYNFLENSSLIENISSEISSYNLRLEKYDLIGKNNEGVISTFSVDINL
ncbi:MAG: hypothetical protein IJX17_00755 [Clostridia bacterium]|nr:hypothetical protein [Clostridia bacterium]